MAEKIQIISNIPQNQIQPEKTESPSAAPATSVAAPNSTAPADKQAPSK